MVLSDRQRRISLVMMETRTQHRQLKPRRLVFSTDYSPVVVQRRCRAQNTTPNPISCYQLAQSTRNHMAQECGRNTKQQQPAHTYIHHTWRKHVPFFVLDMLSGKGYLPKYKEGPQEFRSGRNRNARKVKLMQTAKSLFCLCWGSFPAYS